MCSQFPKLVIVALGLNAGTITPNPVFVKLTHHKPKISRVKLLPKCVVIQVKSPSKHRRPILSQENVNDNENSR